ncbi:MAG: YIP1 family protein [Acidobacteriota bacterium]
MTVATDEQSPAPATPASERPSPFARIAGLFFSPVETLQAIAQRPDILVPLVLLLALTIPLGIVAAMHVDFASAAREALAGKPEVNPERAAKAIAFAQALGRGVAYASPILSLAVLAIVAGIFLIAFRLMGGEGEYKQAFSVVTYVWYVYIVEGALRSVILTAGAS